MRLTMKTDLCIRILIFLMRRNEKCRIKDIAESLGVSKNHLSVAANKLTEKGFLLGTHGPKGGVEINPKALDRSFYDLIVELEQFDLVECFSVEGQSCTLVKNCKPKKIIKKATKAFLSEFKNHKIRDLV